MTAKTRLKLILKRIGVAVIIATAFSLLAAIDIIYQKASGSVNSYYLPILGTLAAGSITFASIVHSLFLKDESKRIYIKRTFLRNCLTRLQDWRKQRDSSMTKIYNDAEKHWTLELAQTKPITNMTLVADFLPFFMFVFAILTAFLNSIASPYLVIASSLFFYAGLAMFFWDIYSHINNLKQVESVSVGGEGHGKLWVKQIDDRLYEQGLKVVNHNIKKERKEIDIILSFEGKIANGFFDCFLEGKKLKKWFPDRTTYFADYSYPNGLQLTIDSEFDIGILQGKRTFKDTSIKLTVPLKLTLAIENTGLIPNSINLNDEVSEILIGVYEDPIHLPHTEPRRAKLTPIDFQAERHCLDLVRIKINRV